MVPWRAGTRPKRMPVPMDTPSAKRRTGALTAGLVMPSSAEREEPDQHPLEENGQHDPGSTRDQRHERALGEELPHQSPSRRTHRRANCDLGEAPLPPSQEQPRHVAARQEQHQRDGAHEHQQVRAHVFNQCLVQAGDGERLVFVGVGIELLQPIGNGVHLGLGLPHRDARVRAGRRAAGCATCGPRPRARFDRSIARYRLRS